MLGSGGGKAGSPGASDTRGLGFESRQLILTFFLSVIKKRKSRGKKTLSLRRKI